MFFAGARKVISGTGRSAGREKEHRSIDGEKVHDLAVSNSRVLAASSGPCRHWPTSLRGQGDKTRESRDKIPSAVAISRFGRVPCRRDRKSTRLNSSHGYISYAVFCLKK